MHTRTRKQRDYVSSRWGGGRDAHDYDDYNDDDDDDDDDDDNEKIAETLRNTQRAEARETHRLNLNQYKERQ